MNEFGTDFMMGSKPQVYETLSTLILEVSHAFSAAAGTLKYPSGNQLLRGNLAAPLKIKVYT